MLNEAVTERVAVEAAQQVIIAAQIAAGGARPEDEGLHLPRVNSCEVSFLAQTLTEGFLASAQRCQSPPPLTCEMRRIHK